MVAKARKRGIEAYVMSAAELDFKNEFDAVFSNAMLHWIKDSKAVISNWLDIFAICILFTYF